MQQVDGSAWRRPGAGLDVFEDFITLGGPGMNVIVPRSAPPGLVADIQAALISSQLGVSFAYARTRYASREPAPSDSAVVLAFRDVYFAGKNHMLETLGRFRADDQDESSAGATFADHALMRLQATYFAAGFLYGTGHLFEAHAVLRLFLEQVAWANRVRDVVTADEAAGVSPTKAISALKAVLPYVGPFYGFLSSSTHLALGEHLDFVDWSGGVTRVTLRHGAKGLAEGWVLLFAADCWSVVYERTQSQFVSELQNWRQSDDGLALIADRPFLALADPLRKRLIEVADSPDKSA